jgi:sugar (pentulose or hexulose) kinase
MLCLTLSLPALRCAVLCCTLQAGDASGTGLLDVSARVWDPKLASLVDPQLTQWLPTLIGPDEVRH